MLDSRIGKLEMPNWHLKAIPTVCIQALISECRRKSIARRGPQLETLIYEIRDQRVMLDSDLARIYGVPTFRFNEAIKRNRERFPRLRISAYTRGI